VERDAEGGCAVKECIPERLYVPEPMFSVGQYVMDWRGCVGKVMERSYNNLFHAHAWRYMIQWGIGPLAGEITNHHYCCDLVLSPDQDY
jgi:hypothetical protein